MKKILSAIGWIFILLAVIFVCALIKTNVSEHTQHIITTPKTSLWLVLKVFGAFLAFSVLFYFTLKLTDTKKEKEEKADDVPGKKEKKSEGGSSWKSFRKWLSKLFWPVALILVWWFWHPINECYIPKILEKRPGYIKEEKPISPVIPKKEASKKTWQLKWEQPSEYTRSCPSVPRNTFEVHFTKQEESGIEFDLSDFGQTTPTHHYSLVPMTEPNKVCYGTYGTNKVYSLASEKEVWKWSGSYRNRQTGKGGKVFLSERSRNNGVEFFGKVSLEPQYRCNKMIGFVIFQE